ncbi:MAG: TIGR00270 family protein [Thermoplasmatales archaeon]|nr:MAG: TIGR00270 family protein [Thermoplasmatales archaeon]
MQCELCGREGKGCREATVDGVTMMLCPGCVQHGENVTPISKTPAKVKKIVSQRARRAAPKDIYKDMEKELVPNWFEIIKKARKKKGLNREDLGFRIGERTVTISKIENGDLRPPDKLISKLEKELGITLLEEVKKITTDRHMRTGMTLGDFIKKEK